MIRRRVNEKGNLGNQIKQHGVRMVKARFVGSYAIWRPFWKAVLVQARMFENAYVLKEPV
jgi:hypothetical protein